MVGEIARHLEVLWCDDVRHELGNKMSMMGIYGSDLVVPQVPVILPKLCAVITLITPSSDPFGDYYIRVLKDDEELLRLDGPSPDIRKTIAQIIPTGHTDQTMISVTRAVVQISPLTIDGPFTLRVRAVTDLGEMWGPALNVKGLIPPETTGETPSAPAPQSPSAA